jgi:hypothetical protein
LKFGTKRYKPDGVWVQTTLAESVVGVQFRKDAAEAYATAVEKAEKAGLQYGVQLEAQPNNPHDRNAIAVYGVCEVKGLFSKSLKEWHIGYLSRDLAEELTADLVSKGVPISAELYSIYRGLDGFLDFKVIVLAPRGHGHKARLQKE